MIKYIYVINIKMLELFTFIAWEFIVFFSILSIFLINYVVSILILFFKVGVFEVERVVRVVVIGYVVIVEVCG